MDNNEIKKMLEQQEVPEKLSPDSIKEMLDKTCLPQNKNITVKRKIIKVVSLAAAFTLVIGVTGKLWHSAQQDKIELVGDVAEHDCLETETIEISNMKYAESYEEVYKYFRIDKLDDYEEMDCIVYEEGEVGAVIGEESVMADGAVEGDFTNGSYDTETSFSSDKEYSETYNQEEGVLEADIVKTDGENVYYCIDSSVRMAKVSDGKFTETKTFANIDGYIEEMYLYNNMVIVISTEYVEDFDDYYEYARTNVSFYSNENQKFLGEYKQDGDFNDVRLMDDGYMYLITNESTYNYIGEKIDEDETEKYIPSYTVNNKEKYLEYSDILISSCPIESDSTYINLASFDVNSENACQPIDVKAVAGSSGNVYCSQDNLYITYGWNETEITRFSIDDGKIIPKAGSSVNGYIKDQFSMSEYDGYLRVAATYYENGDFWTTNNCVYILDMNLDEVGYITDLGEEETIKSVSFNGDKAYIVTFRQTDPLYSIDLSNPSNPVLMDELKITGYSSYMQQWGDGLLLGFGESGNEEGDLYGLKLSMFDNSDPDNLEVIDSIEINADTDNKYIYSPALSERKALLINPENNIIGIPASMEIYGEESYIKSISYVFYAFENGRFTKLGDLSYSYPEQNYYDDYYYMSEFDRAVIIDNYVYVFSNNLFVSADLKEINEADRCEFEDEEDSDSDYYW